MRRTPSPWRLGLAWLVGLALTLAGTHVGAIRVLEQDAYFGRDLDWAAVGGEVTYLVMGDSHAASAVDTDRWTGAFNYAEIGEATILTHEKVRTLLSRGDTRVMHVLLAADPLPLANLELNANRKAYYYSRFCDFAALHELWGDSMGDALSALSGNATIPFLGNGHQLVGLLLRRAVGVNRGRHRRARGRAWSASDMERAAQWQVNKQFRHRHDAEDLFPQPAAVEAMSRTLDIAREHGAVPVLVSYPVTPEYRAALAERFPRGDWRAAVRDLVGSKSYAVHWFDLTTLFDDRPELFYDPDHLTAAGAAALTDHLRDRLLELGRR